jgi:solute carrier family 20 (sodium-dependent phosphate transporter)
VEACASTLSIAQCADGHIVCAEEHNPSSFFARIQNAINSNDPHVALDEDANVRDMHENAEVFDERTEGVFRYLQVLTSCCDAFAHGANDVANAVGPFAAIWHIYRKQSLSKKSEVPVWILVIGGAGIVVGLATYGYTIIKAIGVKLTKITPSRGFCIELGSALVVVTGSYLGLPLSTTHCQVGATAFVGLVEGGRGISWTVLSKAIFGWVATLVIVGFVSALLMALGVFTPNVNAGKAVVTSQQAIADNGLDAAQRVAVDCQKPLIGAVRPSTFSRITEMRLVIGTLWP